MNTYKLLSATTIQRQSDGTFIPTDLANSDYAQFLRDQTAGATVFPADMPSPNVAILTKIAGIESSTQVPRLVREEMMRNAEKWANVDATATNTAAIILAANTGYQRVKAIDDQIRTLRAQIK